MKDETKRKLTEASKAVDIVTDSMLIRAVASPLTWAFVLGTWAIALLLGWAFGS